MQWDTPSFTEIDMSAEIGGYQGDFGPDPSFTRPPVTEVEGAEAPDGEG